MQPPQRIVLISTYDQGRQPFGLASPAAWLRTAGFTVTCADLAVGMFPARAVREADAVFFFLPMHAATRMAVAPIARVRELNPDAVLGCYGLYAPLNAEYLRTLGLSVFIGGEFEADLVRWAQGSRAEARPLEKLQFQRPDRAGLPALDRYAKLRVLEANRDRLSDLPMDQKSSTPIPLFANSTKANRDRHCDPLLDQKPSTPIPLFANSSEANRDRLSDLPMDQKLGSAAMSGSVARATSNAREEERIVGYTEASRGCKHLCRHCPIVPVYGGAFRVVQAEVVLADIRQQVTNGGARHITFGDPDFWNGPMHATRIVEAMHAEFPDLTYDATIKIEHLLRHRDLLPRLRDTGCSFVTTAVESLDDTVLEKLDKGHTRADFIEVAREFRRVGLTLSPTFIAFMPWTTVESYRDIMRTLRDLDLVENVAPVQLGLRLLLPAGSRLLELDEVKGYLTGFDQAALTWRWKHPDPSVDDLGRRVFQLVSAEGAQTRRQVFEKVWELLFGEAMPALQSRAAIPYLTEPWYC